MKATDKLWGICNLRKEKISMSNSTSFIKSTSESSSSGETPENIKLESLVKYKTLILSVIEKLTDGTNLLSLITYDVDPSKLARDSREAFEAIHYLNGMVRYHAATLRDIYDQIGKQRRATTRYFNFSPDGQEIEEVNAEQYNGDKNSSFEEIPDTL